MSRSIVLSNGELCVALDKHAEVRDIYYPHVGLEDHVRGHYIHRVGIWTDGRISWLSEDPAWQIEIGCEEEALASVIVAKHPALQVELHFKDTVYNEMPVFLRKVTVVNAGERTRDIKLYFAHQFEIYKAHGGDTAYFDPLSHSIIHYKGKRVFLASAILDGVNFTDFATGRANFQGKEGSHRDADDGILSKNPIEHGPADSILGVYGSYAPRQSRVCHYWIAAAQSIAEAQELNRYVLKKTPDHIIRTTCDYWKAWLNATERDYKDLSPDQVSLFKKSLMYSRAHVDNGGGIIASTDSDMLQYGLDTYSYVWPRDSAYVALALDEAGDGNVARRFFEFCKAVITADGYLMHKYLPDRSLGSSWHPWFKDGQTQLPIQEDETALVLYALHQHYLRTKDIEFLESVYAPLVEKAADFMILYRDQATKLPLPTYDLWERKRGASTFTSCTVVAALMAAADLSKILGKKKHEDRYRKVAKEIQTAILAHLWDEKSGSFINMVNTHNGEEVRDMTVDISSVYGVFSFGILPHDDPKLARAFEHSVRTLSHGIGIGGIARFENDDYYQTDTTAPGNPWVLTTLWYAEYLIAKAKKPSDLSRVKEIFDWVLRHAQKSGVLSEQMHPQTGEQVCAAPLTWAHACYVSAVLKYLERFQQLQK